jgi:ELWxxDGT repeat protein
VTKTLITISIVATLVFSGINPLAAQVSLVKDINATPAQFSAINDYTDLFCNCGQYLFFSASTETGRELWRTDGTADGTILVKDIYKGYQNGLAGKIFCNGNGKVFFLGNDGSHGLELWISDGTTNGTEMVKDITPGTIDTASILELLGNTVYFLADHDLDNQRELWRSDGTESNTVMVGVSDFPGDASIYTVIKSDTRIFLNLFNTTSNKFEFRATDGTSGNTTKLMDSQWIVDFKTFGNKIRFATNDQTNNLNVLWSSDGTLSGTIKIKDFGSSYIENFHKFNDQLIFTFSGATWISDGTDGGTRFLTYGFTNASAVVGNNFYGLGYDPTTSSNRLFKTNGSAMGIVNMNGALGDINMLRDIPIIDNKLILQYYSAAVGKELGISDEFLNITLVKDIHSGTANSAPRSWAVFKDRVYFLADDGVNGSEIWSTDGTAHGSFLLKNVIKGTDSAFGPFKSGIAKSEGKLHFLAATGTDFNQNLYISDGTAASTMIKFKFGPGFANLLGQTNPDLIYFSDRKFYKTNGSISDVSLVKDLSSDNFGWGITEGIYYTLGNKLIFPWSTYAGNNTTGYEYWITDGTDNGTHILKDINPGQGDAVTGVGLVLNSKFIFDAYSPASGFELWSSDGTEAGTTLLKDINSGLSDSQPSSFALFKNKIIFSSFNFAYGREAWITDGTSEGTVLLADIVKGVGGSQAKNFTPIGDVVLFTGYTAEKGWCLWITDGTTAGTKFLKDIDPGKNKYNEPLNFKSINGKAYFAADDGEHGLELWISDGTEPGTHIIDIVPGAQGSIPSLFTGINGVTYFKADAALWRTNGSITGTLKVSDLEPQEIIALNNWIYFTAPHPDYGIELFKVEFTKLDQAITLKPIENKVMGAPPFQLEAVASSGLPVAITSEEELSMASYTATILKSGTVKITAQQAGDELFNPAPIVTQTFCISPAKPTITLTEGVLGNFVLTSSADVGNQWYEQAVAIADATRKTFEPAETGTYKVSITLDGCTSDFSDEKFITITGIEQTNSWVTFYPNPAKEMVKIEVNNVSEVQLSILDMQGRRVASYQLNGNEFVDHSLEGYSKGLYLVQIRTDNRLYYKKLIKE